MKQIHSQVHTRISVLILIGFLSIGIAQAQKDYSPGFDAGQPQEMQKLLFLEGSWNISLKWTDDLQSDKDKWYDLGQTKSEFSPLYDGIFMMEKSDGFPLGEAHEGFDRWAYTSIYSFDRFQKRYRCVAFDNIMALADIYEADGNNENLTFSNQHTSTFNNHGTNNSNQKNKFTLNKLSDESFELIWFSIDESKLLTNPNSDWDLAVYMLYQKVSD
ncbi:MAG: hypothetical protein HRT61_19395 [Ekhidna sp.]|nr:hypothetical protein [Ekhidna sp.]